MIWRESSICLHDLEGTNNKYRCVVILALEIGNPSICLHDCQFVYMIRRGTNNKGVGDNDNGRFPEGARKEEIQQWRRSACARELRRPTTLCCGENSFNAENRQTPHKSLKRTSDSNPARKVSMSHFKEINFYGFCEPHRSKYVLEHNFSMFFEFNGSLF